MLFIGQLPHWNIDTRHPPPPYTTVCPPQLNCLESFFIISHTKICASHNFGAKCWSSTRCPPPDEKHLQQVYGRNQFWQWQYIKANCFMIQICLCFNRILCCLWHLHRKNSTCTVKIIHQCETKSMWQMQKESCRFYQTPLPPWKGKLFPFFVTSIFWTRP